jgi:hypothetical protein
MTQSHNTRLSRAVEAFKLEELERRLEFDDPVTDGDASGDGVDVVLWSWKFW